MTTASILAEVGPDISQFRRREFSGLGGNMSGQKSFEGAIKRSGIKKPRVLMTAVLQAGWLAVKVRAKACCSGLGDGHDHARHPGAGRIVEPMGPQRHR
jgi:hypothetical protein